MQGQGFTGAQQAPAASHRSRQGGDAERFLARPCQRACVPRRRAPGLTFWHLPPAHVASPRGPFWGIVHSASAPGHAHALLRHAAANPTPGRAQRPPLWLLSYRLLRSACPPPSVPPAVSSSLPAQRLQPVCQDEAHLEVGRDLGTPGRAPTHTGGTALHRRTRLTLGGTFAQHRCHSNADPHP